MFNVIILFVDDIVKIYLCICYGWPSSPLISLLAFTNLRDKLPSYFLDGTRDLSTFIFVLIINFIVVSI